MCLIVWLIYEIWYTTHRNAAVYDLQLDAAVDISVLTQSAPPRPRLERELCQVEDPRYCGVSGR